jgi:mono/diheme cytochrome c family protein
LLAAALAVGAAPRAAVAQQPASATDTAAATPAVAATLDQDVVEEGRKIFHGQGGCFGCHGGKLQGGPIAPSLRGPTFRHSDGSLEGILHVVRGGVPGTAMISRPGGISDPQAIQAANYVWAVSQGKAPP